MTPNARTHAADLRGATRLAVDATQAVTTIVEDMHRAIGGPILDLPPARLPRSLVYRSIRGVTGLVGASLDRVLDLLTPVLGEGAAGGQRDILQAALNGVMGDHLAATANPLAVEMAFCDAERTLPLHDPEALAEALPNATGRLLVLVHGSCMAPRMWCRKDHDHGAALADAFGLTPVRLRYNSGLHVAQNGAQFAAHLEALVAAWPVPVESITVLAYSMGGLITRSACRVAEADGLRWRSAVDRIVFLGTPHHGAPLERAGNWIDTLLDVSRYSAPLGRLGRLRSAGITDLRFGSVAEEDCCADRFRLSPDRRRPVPLPAGVECFALAGRTRNGRLADLQGDGLVPVASALGQHARGALDLGFAPENVATVTGVSHLDLLCDATVYQTIRDWLRR